MNSFIILPAAKFFIIHLCTYRFIFLIWFFCLRICIYLCIDRIQANRSSSPISSIFYIGRCLWRFPEGEGLGQLYDCRWRLSGLMSAIMEAAGTWGRRLTGLVFRRKNPGSLWGCRGGWLRPIFLPFCPSPIPCGEGCGEEREAVVRNLLSKPFLWPGWVFESRHSDAREIRKWRKTSFSDFFLLYRKLLAWATDR